MLIRRAFQAASCAALALLLVPVALAAQTPIRAGETVAGLLTDDDLTLPDDSKYDEYVYRGRRGEQLTIVMRSVDFDAYLLLGHVAPEGDWELLADDDDGAGGSDARIRFTLPADGSYEIRANSFEANGRGAYTLSVESAPPGAPVAPTDEVVRAVRITAGQTISGVLSTSDSRLEDGSFYDTFIFSGRAGQSVTITMRSADFDAYLGFGAVRNGEWSELATDDDGAGGTDAQVTFTLPADGDYLIRANSLGADQVGAYTLTLGVTGS